MTPTTSNPRSVQPLDVASLRSEFPILRRKVHGKPLAYLDNAATTQKPQCVLDALNDYYITCNANVHRSPHRLSEEATIAYENTRQRVARFIRAPEPANIIFVRGATEAINLVAQSFGQWRVRAGDEIIVSEMEHHSNIVPWQLLCERSGAVLRVIPINDAGELVLDAYADLLSERTRLVAVTHISNALGTVNPVERITAMAHEAGAAVLIDGAQAMPHHAVDVTRIGCDFYAFSGHKMYGPTGIGVLYGRGELLAAMPPYHGGGEMIEQVSFSGTTFRAPPARFEAGTPDIAGAIGLAAAVDFLDQVGLDAIEAHEQALLQYAVEALSEVAGVKLVGTAADRAAAISFTLAGAHPHDLATVLDSRGVAIRAGHHCAQPVMERFGLPATARASLALYNTREEIDALAAGLRKAGEMFG